VISGDVRWELFLHSRSKRKDYLGLIAMLHKIYGFFFQSSYAEFPSKFNLEESLDRLTKKIESEKRKNSAYPKFAFEISVKGVEIESSNIPFHINMKPQFTGKCECKNEELFLVGKFGAPTSIRFIIFILLATSFYTSSAEAYKFLAIPNTTFSFDLLYFLVGTHFFLLWGYLISENDVTDISEAIQSALQGL
jgi:hypothetical protein